MSNFNVGDTVRVGKGKVDFTIVSEPARGVFNLKSEKSSRKEVSSENLTLVSKGEVIVPVPTHEEHEARQESVSKHVTVPEFYNTERLDTFDERVEAILSTLAKGTFVIIDNEEPKEFKSFEAAAFALSRNHTYDRAVIVRDNVVKATR
jgi:hypothetical protein